MKYLFLTFLVLSVIVVSVFGESDECEIGDKKQIECNKCKCINNKWACTKRLCVRTRREALPQQQHCQPGSTFKKACNTCTCNDQGTNARCTLRACLN